MTKHQLDSERRALLQALWNVRQALVRKSPLSVATALQIIDRAVTAPSDVSAEQAA